MKLILDNKNLTEEFFEGYKAARNYGPHQGLPALLAFE
jgi:hypothetical protein